MTDEHLLISRSLRDNDYKCFNEIEIIGHGAFASVHKCEDSITHKEFATKKIEIRDAKYEDMLVREVLVYAALGYNERLVQFYGSRRIMNTLHIFIEYVPGGTLHDYLERYGSLSENKTSKITKQILEGTEYLHQNRIVHRDIKPLNILMIDNEHIKLTDFGLSKYVANVSALNLHTICGTLKYMAPELLEEKETNKSVDIWSIGITVMETATGEQIYPTCGIPQFLRRMAESHYHIDIPRKLSKELKYFLTLAFVVESKVRPSATDMMHTKFIKLHS